MPTTDFPGTPKLQKGALAVYPDHTAGMAPTRVIYFQYNPDSLKRTLADRAPPPPKKGNVGAAKEDVLRVQGPPIETIGVTIELDALENPPVAANGLHPALATLELLMYPSTNELQRIAQESQQGKANISPAALPLVLFVWGQSRVVPVDITSFSVTEEAFDTSLNPIRAKVELAMRVLTKMELPSQSLGGSAWGSYHQQKETLASQHTSTGNATHIPNAPAVAAG
jgi:hypothetical protein